MELPVPNYTTALFFALLSYFHLFFRLLTVAGPCSRFGAASALPVHRLVPPRSVRPCRTFLAATSPLFFFSRFRRPFPDVWALALGVHGFAFLLYLILIHGGWHRPCHLSLCSPPWQLPVKPSAFCLGLQMLGLLLEQHKLIFPTAMALLVLWHGTSCCLLVDAGSGALQVNCRERKMIRFWRRKVAGEPPPLH